MDARAHIGLAQQARYAGDRDAALEHQRAAIALLRAAGDPAALAHAIRHLADMLVEAGRAAEAGPWIGEALDLYRSAPEAPPLDMANALRSAAVQAEAAGDTEAAREAWREARDHYARLDDLFAQLAGKAGNPGVAEAERRLAALNPSD